MELEASDRRGHAKRAQARNPGHQPRRFVGRGKLLSDRIATAVAAALGNGGLADLRTRLSQAQPFAVMEVFSEFNLPHIPTKAEIVGRARALLANSPSMEDIAAKAHKLLLEAIGSRLETIAAKPRTDRRIRSASGTGCGLARAAEPDSRVSRIENDGAEKVEKRGAELGRGFFHVRDPSA